MIAESEHDKGLLRALRRLAESEGAFDADALAAEPGLSREEREIVRLFGAITRAERTAMAYDRIKHKFTSDTLGIAHWEMEVTGDPLSRDNPFTWSPELRRMLGFSGAGEFPNFLSSWSNRLHPDDRERVMDAFIAHLNDRSGRTPYNIEYRLEVKDGSYRHFRAFGLAIRDGAGAPRRVIGALEDIDAQKRLQEAVAQRGDLLLAQAHWYKSILDVMPLPISVTNAEMNWTFINRAAEAFLGIRRDEMIGKPCSSWNSLICGTDACGIACAKRGEKQTFFMKNGASYQVDAEILRDLKGETAGFIEVVHDVTRVEAMARAEADAANRAKSAFLATMSHEIRTPLNAIAGMTAIGRNAPDAGRKDYALGRIEDASAHLLGIVNDILDMSKIEANKLELSSVEFNFERMLQQVLTVIGYHVQRKKQKFSVHVESSVPRFLIGDDQRLSQVITNLLSNAVKFTREGGEIRLRASLLGEEEGLCELWVEVADDGIGISPEQQTKLFSAFGQAESGISREFGGTGLGLAISKHIVTLMGGEIWVDSKPGRGSRFLFTAKLPSGVKSLRSLLKPGVDWEAVRVLAADESTSIRQYFQDSFERMGIPCVTVSDGLSAQQEIEAYGPFDVCFIAWHMPEMDGVELTKWIKARGEPGVVVLFSAADWETLRSAAADAGADRYMQKPILSSALADCMNECAESAAAAGAPGSFFAGKTLLLADDVEINREIVLSLLEETGLAIDCAVNGREALAMVEAAPDRYDAVLMDMQMPLMDGLEATRRIRALPDPHCALLPIIAMTANVFTEDIANCLAAGMNDHLGKPLDFDDMLEKLKTYLR